MKNRIKKAFWEGFLVGVSVGIIATCLAVLIFVKLYV